MRTTKLDPARQYIFAVYPHGILIVSRIGLYGGAPLNDTQRNTARQHDAQQRAILSPATHSQLCLLILPGVPLYLLQRALLVAVQALSSVCFQASTPGVSHTARSLNASTQFSSVKLTPQRARGG